MIKRRTRSLLVVLGALLVFPEESAHGQVGTAEVNGVSLRYQIEGSGKPLVLIHGWAVHRGFWDSDVGRLAPHYTVIRYDRRGFGESSGKPDLTADAADLKALLETLGHTRAHIMGHSQGTDVALTFAVRFPEMVDALILFGPPPPAGFALPPDENPFPVMEWVMIGRAHGVDSLKNAMRAYFSVHPAFGDDLKHGRDLLDKYTGLDLIDPAPPSNLVEPARIGELRAVRAPTLVLFGEREMLSLQIAADALTYGITGAKKVVIPGGGHAVNWSEPERFAAEVLRFLRKADSSKE